MIATTPAMATARPGDALSLLAEMPAWGSEFDRTFANHAPMVLVALARIGGTPDQMRRFFEHYRDDKTLQPFAAPSRPLTRDTWPSAIGERTWEPDLRLFFSDEVSRLGRDAALRLYLPVLAPGVGASAFHALMRMAYSILRDDDAEVGISLAYWAATYLPLAPSTGAAPITDDPAEVLRRTAAIEPLHHLKLHDLLWHNMRDANAEPQFAPVVDWLAIGPGTLEKMASVALTLFAATQHFAALHVITGLHWIRIVSAHCDAPTLHILLRVFWQGIAALSGELGFPVLPEAESVERWRHTAAPGWTEIQAAAVQSFDEHDISLVFSASEEMKVYHDPLYRVVAARRLGLIGDYRT